MRGKVTRLVDGNSVLTEKNRAAGRNPDGTFCDGNAGGPGRLKRCVEKDYLRVLADLCTPDEWRVVCEKALWDAQKGDAPARTWLARYLIGDTATLWSLLTTSEQIERCMD